MVQFGLRQNMLNETSTTVDGNRNVSVMNETHTLVIDDLHSRSTILTILGSLLEMDMVQYIAV